MTNIQDLGKPRFGRTKFTTIYRDVNRLREAIRSHDALATEAAWEKVERWLPAIMGGAVDREDG